MKAINQMPEPVLMWLCPRCKAMKTWEKALVCCLEDDQAESLTVEHSFSPEVYERFLRNSHGDDK